MRNISFTFTARGSTLESDYRRPILTTKVDPRSVRVKHQEWHMFDFKLNKLIEVFFDH